jgi:hypothetical protein
MADAEAEDRGQVQIGDVGETERLRHAASGLSGLDRTRSDAHVYVTLFTILQPRWQLANRLQGIETVRMP